MSNQLSQELLSQLYAQESDTPFLTLVTLSHSSFTDIRLVNNTEDITSNGLTYMAFPMKIVLSKDDGETAREVSIEFDNINRDLITAIRSVTTYISVKLVMVLSALPDQVQMSFEELKIQNISYNAAKVTAKLYMDNFLNTEMTSERYTPSLYPGIY